MKYLKTAMKMKGLILGCAFLCVTIGGCGGTTGQTQGNLASQAGQLLPTDPLLDGRYYYDTWTFVPTQTAHAVFKMQSGSITSFIILKNSNGQTIQTGTAPGMDDNGNFNGNASMSALVLQGQTYTVTTTSSNALETGAYAIEWSDWVQLTVPGN